MEFVGKSVKREFEGIGIVCGTVKSYDSSSASVEIQYDNGLSEYFNSAQLPSLLQHDLHYHNPRKPIKRRRFRHSSEIGANSGNFSDNLGVCAEIGSDFDTRLGNGGNLVGNVNSNGGEVIIGKSVRSEECLDHKSVSSNENGLDLNARINLNEDLNLNEGCTGSLKRRDSFDLNLGVDDEENSGNSDVNYLGCSGGLTLTEDRNIDLNMEVCEEVTETQGDEVNGNEHSLVYALFDKIEQTNINQKSIEGDSACGNLNDVSNANKLEVIHASTEHAAKDAATHLIVESEGDAGKGDISTIDSLRVTSAFSVKDSNYVEVQQTDNSPSDYLGSSRRKRRKVSDNLITTPPTLLRRSSRRASARNQVSGTMALQETDDPLSSGVPSSLTDEKPVTTSDEKYEQCNLPPPKLQLPPSSQNLDLDDLPVLELFSIYTFLRSFSTILFLSPFELEDLVAALKSETPTILFDNIHASILQTLRKHLEYLSNEGCQSASDCLRNLNWDFLDLVTWPIFMAEYLLIHGSGFKTAYDLNHSMFRTDYCKQPVNVKVKILQYLCDEMIEVEALRSELNRRSLATETDVGFNQNTYFDTFKKRRVVMDMSSASCSTEEIVDDTTDWNSDECCLCKMDGSLICCDGCPAAFHSRCVGIASDSLPEGDWYCPECAIGPHGAWMKSRRSLRGADLLGIDLHARLYFNSCGYLLVSDSSDTGSLFNYYHKNDIHVVIEVLKSMGTLYGSILMAIYEHWDIPANLSAGTSNLVVFKQSSCKNVHMSGNLNKNRSDDERNFDENPTVDCSTYPGQEFPKAGTHLDSMTTIESPFVASEGLADTTKIRSGIENVEISGICDSNGSGVSLNQFGIPEKHHPVGDCSLTSASLDVGHNINLRSVGVSCNPSTDNKDTSVVPCGIDFINYYSFARTATLVSEELICKSPEKINVMSEEDIISDQAKAIMKKSSNFCWPSIENLNGAAEKEKCGWCFSCKVANDDRDCLFNDVMKSVLDVPNNTLVGLQSRKIHNGHLRAIICHIVSLEDRLRGLLLGPWLDPHQTNLWHQELMKTSDFLPVKRLLLLLESNLRHFALSADWLKHADSVTTMGSSTHIVVSSSRTSSRHGIARKRARYSDVESNSSSKAASGLGIYWWRGGRLSQQLFNWKSLPRSLVTKAARQAGCKKIPGILYPENSDFARRSKYVAWRAAVEMSTSVAHLALQDANIHQAHQTNYSEEHISENVNVNIYGPLFPNLSCEEYISEKIRELHSNIKWHDIENSHPQYVLDKESRKSTRLFKKVIVRRKCIEGESVKYLLDFGGKRRAIPDIVVKHGSLLEEPSSERKKYWLDESYLPLHLLKNFEEKRIVRKCTEKKHGKVIEIGRVKKRIPREMVFSYLFSKMERSDCQQCGHCNKDVPIREAVSCLHCKGYFHKRHVRRSHGTSTTGYTYSCHRCQDGMRVKANNTSRRRVDSKLQKIQSQKCKNLPSLCKSVNLKGNKKALSKAQQLRSQTNKKIPPSVPLRRSARKVKSLYLHRQMNRGHKKGIQSKKNVGRKKGTQSKSKKLTSQKPKATTAQCKTLAVTTLCKKRTNIYSSYWLNGIRFSTKPNDERVMLFREKKHVISSEDFSGSLDHCKCSLCCLDGCTSNYIACETCGDWFHGDAFGLTLDNARQLIGFRCHVCRDRAAPVCPHMKINALPRTESNMATECAEELSNPVSLQPLSVNDRARPVMQVYTRRSKHGIKRVERREEGGSGNSVREFLGPQQEVINMESKNEGEQNGNHNQLASCQASIGGEEDLGTTTAGRGAFGGIAA
ncbi:PREDICTED: DDT domain-containing protein PTM-like isoform X2 [Lupinus angustifolius]|uniref:DDT domain-containing protein PTM-like isoform X2 n=1 Tax=Lupinus angustifolius TaxID=3871 RepID=UPI00092EF57F|nr:PREDICTED: DDT domain-containing protein PTM-like isoform X2 [Lupinus angustifolius]